MSFVPSPPAPVASHSHSSSAPLDVDPQLWAATCRSIKDRIYQRSQNLRRTYRDLDTSGNGTITLDDFARQMRSTFMLNELEQRCLRVMLIDADFHRDGVIDFREFCEMLKTHDRQSDPVISDAERKRFQSKGLIDPHVRRMMHELDDAQPIRVQNGLPTNELGQMKIECPFGVLGDSERMDAVISTFLDRKLTALRVSLEAQDTNHDGLLAHHEFKAAMMQVDRYIFDDEIAALVAVLDKKKTGLIHIGEFVNGIGHEYLKKKAHRSNTAFDNPFVWAVAGPKKPDTASGRHHRGNGEGPATPRRSKKTASETKSSELRQQSTKLQLQAALAAQIPFTARATLSTSQNHHRGMPALVPSSPRAVVQPSTGAAAAPAANGSLTRLPLIVGSR